MNYMLKIKPLSINQAFKGRRFRTDLYNDYIKDMKDILPKEIDISDTKNVKIAIEFGFSTKLSDIDNCIKPFLDCLVKKYKVDDRYIYELHVFKSIVKKGEEYIKFKIY
jgi:Holliday junction resolvase RusA-like endonuclease